jgi:serpin B
MLPDLAALGMGIAMGKSADFSNMYSTPVMLSKAIHKTYIKVSESGTEAAAVTALGMTLVDLGPNIPAILVNHPFLYFITERQTGAILFIGMVDDPTKN